MQFTAVFVIKHFNLKVKSNNEKHMQIANDELYEVQAKLDDNKIKYV